MYEIIKFFSAIAEKLLGRLLTKPNFMSEENKKTKLRSDRSGFFAVKLTNEALNDQIQNYDKLTGLSSMRGKAGLSLIILLIIGWVGGGWKIFPPLVGWISLIITIFMVITIYKWPKKGIIITFIIYGLNLLFTVISEPTRILGAIFALYILDYFLYPTYQVEKSRIQKMP